MNAGNILLRIADSLVVRVRGFRARPARNSQLPAIESIDWQNDLFVYHHLGLGDMIHCNGMVRYLLTRLDSHCRVHVFCKSRYLEMTAWMYRDEPRIELHEVPTGQNEQAVVNSVLRRHGSSNYLSVGHRQLRALEEQFPNKFFDELFYQQVGIPYDIRYTHCYWQREPEEEERVFRKLVTTTPYAFVHDDPGRGFQIDTATIAYPVVHNDITENVFHLCKVLENAAEVHCMESSIRCMLESLEMQNSQLFYHNFRCLGRPLGNATSLAWKQVSYENGPAK